jgi:hypothetical protein
LVLGFVVGIVLDIVFGLVFGLVVGIVLEIFYQDIFFGFRSPGKYIWHMFPMLFTNQLFICHLLIRPYNLGIFHIISKFKTCSIASKFVMLPYHILLLKQKGIISLYHAYIWGNLQHCLQRLAIKPVAASTIAR